MKYFLKKSLIAVYILSGGLLWGRYFLRRHALIILYHDASPNRMREHVRFLSKLYRPTPLRALDDYYQGRGAFPDKSLIITIDDGWKGNFALMQVARDDKIPLTIFLLAGLIGTNRQIWNYPLRKIRPDLNTDLKTISHKKRLALLQEIADFYNEKEYGTRSMLSLDEINQMREYIDFQSHGSFHPVLSTCTSDELISDLNPAKSKIETLTGSECYAIAYPYGKNRMGKREAEFAERAGYRIGRVANDPRVVTTGEDRMLVPSLNIPDDCDVETVRGLVAWTQIRSILNT